MSMSGKQMGSKVQVISDRWIEIEVEKQPRDAYHHRQVWTYKSRMLCLW